MPVKICSGVGIGWASCCCGAGCTTRGATGRAAHRQWIDSLTWAHASERAVVDDYLLAIDHTEARLLELDARLAEIAETRPVSGAGRVVALFPGHRYVDGDADPRGAA
jgi:hypothetical protein